MERFALLVVLTFLGYVLFAHHVWEFVRPDDQIIWAALLPGVYLFGMILWKD